MTADCRQCGVLLDPDGTCLNGHPQNHPPVPAGVPATPRRTSTVVNEPPPLHWPASVNGQAAAHAPGADLDGATLLDEVHAFLRGYVAFPSAHAAAAVTLWAAHTHLAAAFESTPRLALLSPEKQCGKSRVIELLELLSAGAETLSDASPAYLYRRIGAGPVTILLDEADAIWKRGKTDETAGVADRPADVWEPLLAVADLAGGDWPKRAREACTAFVTGARDDTASVGTRLLDDLRNVFGDVDALWTETLLSRLHAIDEAPWGDWYGKPLDARHLAKLVKPYGPRSRDVRQDGAVRKGYYREDLEEVWRRYASGGSATAATSATPLASPVADVADVALPWQATP